MSEETASQLAASVVKRLIAELDKAHQPTVGVEQDGSRVELRDWLMLICFSDNHELYDDVMTVLGQGRRECGNTVFTIRCRQQRGHVGPCPGDRTISDSYAVQAAGQIWQERFARALDRDDAPAIAEAAARLRDLGVWGL